MVLFNPALFHKNIDTNQIVTYLMSDIHINMTRANGATSHILNTVYYLRRSGINVNFLALTHPHRCFTSENSQGMVGYSSNYDVAFPPCSILNSLKLYSAIHQSTNIIHERYSAINIAGAIYSYVNHVPLVLEVNAPLIEEWSTQRQQKFFEKRTAIYFTKISFRMASRILVVSETLKQILMNDWKVSDEKIVVLSNAVDVQLFQSPYSEVAHDLVDKLRHLEGRRPICMYVGSLHDWQGVDILIDAFAKLVVNNINGILVIVGDGREMSYLRNQVNQLAISERVIFIGEIPHKSVPYVLSFADVCVLPYRQLPRFYFSPMKLYEYMAAGKAIVASGQGQILNVIEHNKNGVIVPPNNVEALATAIHDLFINDFWRNILSINALNTVRNNTWNNYVSRLQEVYCDIFKKEK